MTFLKHIGVKRRSGRYPWGSGDDPEQRNRSFLGYVKQLQDEGLSEVQIAEGLGMTTTQLRTRKSIAKSETRAAMAAQAQKLKEKGMSNVAIGKRMKINESSVRSLLDPALQARSDIAVSTAKMLRDTVEKKGVIDIGAGIENHIGITRTKLNTAVSLLEEEGYKVHYVKVEQLGTGKFTTIKVIAPPGMTYSEIYKNRDNIKGITDYSEDGGRSFLGLEPINSVNGKRVLIRYGEEGGSDKDGVIELRRGVDDISLGSAKYAQVRVGVDGTHYMKGMAMYADKLPHGVDIIYNTNKPKGTPPEKVFKSMKEDLDNPFGTVVRQKHYVNAQGKKQLSALNIVNEEGSWGEWSKSISSQVLSKQSPALAKKQLDMARSLKLEEYDEILSLTNPVIKKALLREFADGADAAAVHLKAAALPRQSSHVILPFPTMKTGEIYAPNYRDGESVVLIRHPHGGTFEIPELRVNNRNSTAKSIIGNAIDAVGIHPDVAKKLSGADFDGDTVLVIPNNRKEIITSPSLRGLADFDPKIAYPAYDGMPKMSNRTKQMQMGDVSNLITDMTIKGASANEIARAVRHSMVVIDAEKHHLNYKQSALDNGISELKKKYQGGERAGASTLISKASSEIRVPQRKDSYRIDPATGKKVFDETGSTFVNNKGKLVKKTTSSTRMAETDDALTLSSGTKIESIYADHANSLKSLANKARLELLRTPNLIYSPSAKEIYRAEVESLKAKLRIANMNRPLERQAQLLANKIVRTKRDANPKMEPGDLKKIKGQALEEARARAGAKKQKIEITDREWEAIQLGAVSNNTLSQIITNTDTEALRKRATPRTAYQMTTAKVARAKSMAAAGYTTSEIASALGVSTTSIQEAIK
jgi:DNA-binding CsgD family transcriptional regulator